MRAEAMEQRLLSQGPLSKGQIMCLLEAGEIVGHREQGNYLRRKPQKGNTELGILYKNTVV